MKKSTYIFISLLFSVGFWDVSFITKIIPPEGYLILSCSWSLSSYLIYLNNPRNNNLYSRKYIRLMYYILVGVFISMISADLFWKQDFGTTFVSQRSIYSIISLPAILFVQPSEKELIKALKWISILTVTIWVVAIFYPQILNIDQESIERTKSGKESDIGYNITGIYFVLIYLYYKIGEYIKEFTFKTFLSASFWFVFLILFQNRSMLIGIIPVLVYSIIKFKYKNKFGLIIVLSILIILVVLSTMNIWMSLINQTQEELSTADYNRIKSLNYYLLEYSPNWFCYIFGNGFPSAHTSFGQIMWDNFEQGLYASDIGLIGMWTTYGLLPLITIYTIVIKIIRKNHFPLFLKFVCFHVLFVPTIFQYWENPGVMFFVLIFYLFAYYNEKKPTYAINNNNKL